MHEELHVDVRLLDRINERIAFIHDLGYLVVYACVLESLVDLLGAAQQSVDVAFVLVRVAAE